MASVSTIASPGAQAYLTVRRAPQATPNSVFNAAKTVRSASAAVSRGKFGARPAPAVSRASRSRSGSSRPVTQSRSCCRARRLARRKEGGLETPARRGGDDGRFAERGWERDQVVSIQIASDLHLESSGGAMSDKRAFRPAEGRELHGTRARAPRRDTVRDGGGARPQRGLANRDGGTRQCPSR